MADIEQEPIASQANNTAENTPSVGDNPKKSFLSKIPHAKIVVPVGILCLLLIGGIVMFTYVNQQQKKQTQEKVYQALHAGNFKVAQNLAQEALKKNPNDKYLKITLIDAISGQGNQTGKEKEALTKVQPYIDSALATGANDRDTLISVGYAYETAGEYEKALGYYEQAITLDPKFAPAYFHKGHTLAFLDKAQESQAAYDKSYVLDSNNPLTLLVKGNMLQKEGKYTEAVEAYKKAANNKQSEWANRAEAYTAASLLEGRLRNNKDALSDAELAYRFSPSYSLGLGNYGMNLALSGNTEAGLQHIRNAIQGNSRMTINYIWLAVILRSEKDYTQAIQLLQSALEKVDADNTLVGIDQVEARKSQVLYELAETYSEKKDVKNALLYLELAIKSSPALKEKLKLSQTGYFKDIRSDSDYIALINS